MQTEIILAKYGELALKGLNRNTFEDILMKNIKRRLKPLGKFTYTRAQSTIYIEPETPDIDLDVVMDNMKKIFGIAALCKACVCEKDLADISRVGIPYLEEILLGVKTFKVEAKRADKQFPLKSPEICRELGGQILEAYPHLQVDVKHPDVTVMVEIREKHAFVHAGNEEVQAVCQSAVAEKHCCSYPAVSIAQSQVTGCPDVAFTSLPFTMSAHRIPLTVHRKK